MEFDHFGLSRDLLYLASLLVGASAGVFLITRRRKCTLRQRSLLISVILCLLSCVLASLAASVILTRGMVFAVPSVYPFVVLFLALGALVVYFPRAGLWTVIFIAGFYIAWISFSFLAFPRCREPVRLTVRSSGGELFFYQDEETWNFRNDGKTVTFEAASITAHPSFPLIGGEQRGLITRVLRDDEQLFGLTGRLFRFFGGPGFFREFHSLNLPMGVMLPGAGISALFDGKKLYFDPPIRL